MRYGFHASIRRGRRISLFLTMRCPLNCSYCSLRVGGFPLFADAKPNELNLDEWKLLLINLFRFMSVSEIIITGGEPTLRDDVSGLINFLLRMNKCVILHSNLWTDNALSVYRTNRFRILSTFHEDDSESRYLNQYAKYSKYRINATEIEKKELEVTTQKPFEIQGPEISGMTDRFAISPDGHIFVRQKMMYKHLRSV